MTATATDLSFDAYFQWLLKWEGTVYENDPDDPGGATKYGIDQRSHPDLNIRTLTREGAKGIYWREYWIPSAGDRLPGPVAWAVTDCRVNCGPRASQWLQEALSVAQDGRIGPVTLAAANSRNPQGLAAAILDRREQYYRVLGRNPKRRKYLAGWLNRNNDLRRMLA